MPSHLPTTQLAALARRYARVDQRWLPVPAELDAAIAADAGLAAAARAARVGLVGELAGHFTFRERLLEAMLAVPRERFVLPEDIAASADDTPVALDGAGHATVSAPHAYLLTYELLELAEGDHYLELGTGTGYGAALARRIVGPRGSVTSIEIDPALHARARRLLGVDDAASDGEPGRDAGVTLLLGDGRTLARRILSADLGGVGGAGRASGVIPRRIAFTYALREAPVEIEGVLPEGARLVAPVGDSGEGQELVRVERRGGGLRREGHGAVRYVAERTPG
jgi:protein-L-isoaspartate(D-aspartate) O-methyltransferase